MVLAGCPDHPDQSVYVYPRNGCDRCILEWDNQQAEEAWYEEGGAV